jgi:threonine synthase
VSATMGRLLGVPGMVATTTGNHGTSLAAYCGRASIPAIAVMSVQSDVIHRAMTAMYGGLAVVSTRPEALMQHLVHECGWCPVTSLGGSAANPFGVEGYKTIAFELFEDLDFVPDAVLVPTASGDLLYGVYKGFHELQELGFASACPRMIACQAEGAAPLARAMREELEEVPVLAAPETVAISIGDPTSGAPALEAIRRSGGHVVTVSDEEILASQRQLAAHGLLVEAASAAAVAASAAGVKAGLLRGGDRIVCLLTGSGAKWSTQLLSSVAPKVLLEPSEAMLSEVAQKVGRTG